MTLLEKYEAMKNQTSENDLLKQASAEELEVIEKYASVADELLAEEYGEDYTEDDVVELATKMIKYDSEEITKEAEDVEKVAALEEAGRIMAKAFLEEINKAG